MLILSAITIVALTYASIHSIIAANREAELERLERIVELATTSRFPLSPTVLEDMKLLSGAEFVFESEGKSIAQTQAAPPIPKDIAESTESPRVIRKKIESNGQPYLYTSVSGIRNPSLVGQTGSLHIFVPSQSNQETWWQASRTPLMLALVVMLLAVLFSFALASQVTRPLAKLNEQVNQIAGGKIEPIPEVRGNDEIHDLNVSINQMAVKLRDRDDQIRKNERLQTMVQFGSGIAHHLRNSSTGCKMAVQLLANERRDIIESENYQVALRQLGLMDNYIKKFLMLSKSPESQTNRQTDVLNMNEVLEVVVFLMRPSAEHLGVELKVQSNCDESEIRMSEEDCQQLMMNLISNAIRAASERPKSDETSGKVIVDLAIRAGTIDFSVTDNGDGPPQELSATLFDPFVTGAKEGTGLGLALVKEISDRAGGGVSWSRENQLTTFRFTAKSEAIEKVQ